MGKSFRRYFVWLWNWNAKWVLQVTTTTHTPTCLQFLSMYNQQTSRKTAASKCDICFLKQQIQIQRPVSELISVGCTTHSSIQSRKCCTDPQTLQSRWEPSRTLFESMNVPRDQSSAHCLLLVTSWLVLHHAGIRAWNLRPAPYQTNSHTQ